MSRSQRTKILGGLLFAAAAGMLAGACARTGPGRCPQKHWCGTTAQAESVAESIAGDTFTCPIDLNTGVALEAGQKPPAGLPIDVRVTLDERATHLKQKSGETDTCCYKWTEPCGQ